MANLRGAGAPRGRGRGQGRGRGRGRQPRIIPIPEPEQQAQEPNQQITWQEAMAVVREQREMLDEQRGMIEELRAERQAERQARHEEEEQSENEEESEEDDRQTEEAEGSERSQSPPRHERAVVNLPPIGDANTSQYWVTQFRKLKPPYFQGKLEMAEDWLMKLEKIFGVMECPENRKAQLAIFMLEGDADRWWKVMEETLRTRYCPVTWEKFLEKFNEQYFPPSIQVTKEAEFLRIQQGHEETVDDYFARFTNLSRYSSHLRRNGDESSMVNILMHGLKYEIKDKLVSQRFTEVIQAVESCRLIERNLRELHRSRHISTSNAERSEVNRGNSSRKREAPWNDSQRESKRPFQTGQRNNPRMPETRPCSNCGRNHPGVNCIGRQVCYGCRKPGHLISNCPEKVVERRVCYRCQKPGHISIDCPEIAAKIRPQNSGRMYAMTRAADRELPEMVQGTISFRRSLL